MSSQTAAVIFLECPCGLNKGIPVEQFDYDGAITQCPDKHVVVECPDCSDTRKTTEFSRIHHPGDSPWYKLTLDQPKQPTGGKNPFQPFLDGAHSLDDQDAGTVPACEGCGSDLSEGHKRWGPDAPDSGWAYYECPDCGHKTRAD